MKYSKTCECCGHKITAYTMPLNQSLVAAFIHFAEKYLKERKGLKKGEIGLTNAQYSNFQNLRHFGIIIQYEKGNEWHLTKFGEDFYYGSTSVLSPAGHLNGETLSESHEAWQFHDKSRRSVFIDDVLPNFYKQRPQYQKEKSNQLSMI